MATYLSFELHSIVRAILESGVSGVSGGLEQKFDDLIRLTNGNGSGQANRVWLSRDRTLAGAATESIDLIGGGLTDIYGNVFAPTLIKGIFTRVTSTTALGGLYLGPHAANGAGIAGFWKAASDADLTPSGGLVDRYDPVGFAAVGGASDILYAENKHASAQLVYSIMVLGAV
jgi:hypothetical protein